MFDWKEWFGDNIRNMEGLSFHRAFLITRKDDFPVFHYKKSLLYADWRGHVNNPEGGLKLLKAIPERRPCVIYPENLPEEMTRDLLSFPAMSSHYKQYWSNWITTQFDDMAFRIPRGWRHENFWNSPPDSSSTSSVSEQEPETDPGEHDIIIWNHPSCIPIHELRIGSIIAIAPAEDYYDVNPEQPKEDFWLAIIKGVCQRCDDHIFRIEWYDNENRGTNLQSCYTLNGIIDQIYYQSILHFGIDLTQRSSLRKRDERLIERAINSRN